MSAIGIPAPTTVCLPAADNDKRKRRQRPADEKHTHLCLQSYDVLVGRGLLRTAGTHIAAVTGSACAAVISDDCVFRLYGEALCASLEAAGLRTVHHVFPRGEGSKIFWNMQGS